MTYKVKNRQSIFDVAIAVTGSVDLVVEIAKLNDVGLDHVFEHNTDVSVPVVINQPIVLYLGDNSIIPISDQKQIESANVGDIRSSNFGDESQGWIRTTGELVKNEDYPQLFLSYALANLQYNLNEFRLPDDILSKIYVKDVISTYIRTSQNLNFRISAKFLSLLPDLTYFDISNNSFNQIDFPVVPSDISFFKIDNNNFAGEISFRNGIAYIRINNNSFSKVNFINVSSLIDVVASYNNITSDIDFSSCTNLERVDFNSNQIQNIIIHDNCESVNVRNNPLLNFDVPIFCEILNIGFVTTMNTVDLSRSNELRRLIFNFSSLRIVYVSSSNIDYVDSRSSNNSANDNTQLMQSLIDNNCWTSGDFLCTNYADETIANTLRNAPFRFNVTGTYTP